MTRRWLWRKNYRVWDADRKVFLYPENWIEPDLRPSRGALFRIEGASRPRALASAQALAGALGMDLYRVSLSSMVSKYIGETEKNLGRVFDAAGKAGAVLMIDEADALLGKRSEVKDSHDRYANIEVDYLLERLERYSGFVILATGGRVPSPRKRRRRPR